MKPENSLEYAKALIEKKADVNASDGTDETALIKACRNDNLALTQFLLRSGADLNHVNKGGYTPVMVAACLCRLENVQYLLSKGASLSREQASLVLAESTQANSDLQKTLSASRAEFKPDYEASVGVVKILLDKGADVNYRKEESDKSPLYCAATDGNYGAIQLLLGRGAKPLTTEEAQKALVAASMVGNPKIVEMLLARGADIDGLLGPKTPESKRNEQECTPLFGAAMYGRFEAVKLLITKEADVNLSAREGRWSDLTPLQAVLSWGEEREKKVEMTRFLLEHKADPNIGQPQPYGVPLVIAASSGEIELVKLLAEKGARINRGGEFDKSPLEWALENDHLEVVRYLLAKGAVVDKEVLNAAKSDAARELLKGKEVG